ncbi:MAG: hypothetical protein M1327_07365 [Candidatus Thermoplasmatota archaeon]|nr:hypothetical protein [Candidatus Thermoplasmatota archaeon]
MSKIEIVDKLELQEVSSKDMTRKKIYKYIFGDLTKGFYIVGSLFLDAIVIPQVLSFVPASFFSPQLSITIVPPEDSTKVAVLIILIYFALVLAAIYFEVKYYIAIWRK